MIEYPGNEEGIVSASPAANATGSIFHLPFGDFVRIYADAVHPHFCFGR
jgi:hypothetical protein